MASGRRVGESQGVIFSSSDDSSLTKAIQETHRLDNLTFKIRPLLSVIEDIISLTNCGDFQDIRGNRIGFFNDIHLGNKTSMVDEMTLKINQISWEILGNVWGGSNVQDTVLNILNAVSSFFWAGKGVIALAAFAVNYGEVWLVNQLQSTNLVAQSLALVDQFPSQMENKSMFHEMAKLIMAVLNLIKCITESVDVLEHKYVDQDKPLIKNMIAQIPEYTYWIIRGIVTCQSRLSNLDESEPFETEIVDTIVELGRSMRKQLDLCYLQAEQKRIEEVYGKIKKLIEITSNPDSVQILKALISEEEEMPLYNGHTKELVKIDTLRKKVTLLYITPYPLQTMDVQLSFLSEMYEHRNASEYDIVWFPVVEAGALSHEQKLEIKELQIRMPWLSFSNVSLLDPAVVKYMKEDLQFEKRSMIKVLDSKGRLMKNHDAVNMIFIWGNLAFPFSEKKEADLWDETPWGLDLLLNFVVPESADKGKLVCIYGGSNIGWIQQFATTILDISRVAKKQMMVLYMGEKKTSEVMKNMNIGETLILIDPKTILFWARLECMWYSRVQIGKPQESDEIIKEVFKMVSFEHSGRGWALIVEAGKMAKGMGDTMLTALLEYDQWKKNVETGFVSALEQYMMRSRSITSTSTTPTNILVLPKTKIGLPEKMECFECQREMRRSIKFNCCGD